ncbi:hypothetical protein GRI75_01135 [Altererythrobacter soli]|uniref:Secreted protein n=1 Tax=Croceibacterium soli TaxID=1739690 RepID=A0A6I4URT0_9SPHN|nr:hypothetical protein [Croceibacterium soli]MXP40247.1 hypothetical protein [Croceibacterium soli]
MSRFHLASIALLASAVTTWAPVHAATAERSEAQEQQAEPDPVRCKDTMVIGSRIPVRVCRPKSEWDAEARALQEERRSNSRSGGRCGEVAKC